MGVPTIKVNLTDKYFGNLFFKNHLRAKLHLGHIILINYSDIPHI